MGGKPLTEFDLRHAEASRVSVVLKAEQKMLSLSVRDDGRGFDIERLSDFEGINALGFLYAEEDQGNTYRVFVGDYDDPKDAERVEQARQQLWGVAFVGSQRSC